MTSLQASFKKKKAKKRRRLRKKSTTTTTIHRMLAALLCAVLWSSVEATQMLTLSKQPAGQPQTRTPGWQKTVDSPLTSRAEEKHRTNTTVQETLASKEFSVTQKLTSKEGFRIQKLTSKEIPVIHRLTLKRLSFTDKLASQENDRSPLTRILRLSTPAEFPASSSTENPPETSALQTWGLTTSSSYPTAQTGQVTLWKERLQELSSQRPKAIESTIESRKFSENPPRILALQTWKLTPSPTSPTTQTEQMTLLRVSSPKLDPYFTGNIELTIGSRKMFDTKKNQKLSGSEAASSSTEDAAPYFITPPRLEKFPTRATGSSTTESARSFSAESLNQFKIPDTSTPDYVNSQLAATHSPHVHTSLRLTGSTPSSGSEKDSDGMTTIPDQKTTLTDYCPVSGSRIILFRILLQKNNEMRWISPANSCDVEMIWRILVPQGHLMIFEGYMLNKGEDSRFLHAYKYKTTFIYKSAMDLSKYPTRVPSDYFVLRAFVPHYESPTVIFMYNIWPVVETPVKLATHPYAGEDGQYSQNIYNCSHPYKVPDLWKCDMVQQCWGLEDEPAECPYRSSCACGPLWIQFGDQCLHVMSGYGLHKDLDKMCKQDHDAVQMPLVTKEEIDFVADVVRTVLRKPGQVFFPLRKVRPVSNKMSHLYRYLWQWGSQGSPVAYQLLTFKFSSVENDFALVYVFAQNTAIEPTDYSSETWGKYLITYVCMKPVRNRKKPVGMQLAPANRNASSMVQGKICPDGSVVQKFHSCPLGENGERLMSQRNPPLYPCTQGPPVHYTLFCDGLEDCPDGSDENKCKEADLTSLRNHGAVFFCWNYQLIRSDLQCNGVPDCFDGSDEDSCEFCQNELYLCQNHGCLPNDYKSYGFSCSPHPYTESTPMVSSMPSLLSLDGFGTGSLKLMEDGASCPETHFQCQTAYCIPTYLLNNGEQDCPLGEDENIPTDNFTCPGYYRCYRSGSCVHADFVCDGIPHCPNKDDERYCGLECPQNCTCEGYAFICRQMFDPLQFLPVRYLDLSGTHRPLLKDIHRIPFLLYLNLSRCALTLVSMSNMCLLTVLDLSYNQLEGLGSLQLDNLTGLLHLYLAGNHLTPQLDRDTTIFTQLVNLRTLNLSDTGLEVMTSSAFFHLKELTSLDLRDNPLRSFPQDVFFGLKKLRVLQADDSRLCCNYFHHDIQLHECDAPRDELSSCRDLLNSNFYRVCLWVFSVLAITGNAGVMIYRLCLEMDGSSASHRLLVLNLSLSDFLMGVYIAIIGTADAVFRGQYVSKQAEWKESAACKAAGFLGLLSSEVSAFAICLITLDRFLVIRLPLHHHLHLTKLSSLVACVAVWIVGLVLAAAPLMLSTGQFYGLNGICLPLPITRKPFAGQDYSFGVFIVLNFIIFLIIGVAQAAIFFSIRSSAQAEIKHRRKEEVIIARQLLLIVMTDFCCWFPIGLMGLLASGGLPIPSEVNVLVAVFVLPVNSAVNPFLYTLNKLLEKRAQKRMEKRVLIMMSQLESELQTWPRQIVEELFQRCLRASLVHTDDQLQTTDVGDKYLSQIGF